jgi:hypothetical protein
LREPGAAALPAYGMMIAMTTNKTPVSVRRLLIVLGSVYLASQLVLFSLRWPPSWDEVIYLSQVTPGIRAMMFVASRARGITLLVAPVTIAGGSLTVVRLVLAIMSSAALVVALLMWIPSIGIAAPIAGSFFACSWLALLYGSEVMPNLWSAILGLTVTGIFVRWLTEPDRAQPTLAVALVGSMALMALVRPPDALVLTLSLAAYVLIFQRRAARRLTVLAAGLLLGWIPWLIEMSVRFGGPIEAFQQAVRVGHIERTGLGPTALQHLALTNGPTLGVASSSSPVPIGGVVWWGGMLGLGLVAGVRTSGTRCAAPVRCALFGGLALAAEYLLLVSALAPRFLLPAYALLAVPAAVGAVGLTRDRSRFGRAIAWGVVVLAAFWLVWQVGTARRIANDTSAEREGPWRIGAELRNLAGDGGCAFESTDAFPQIEFASHCLGSPLRTGAGAATARERLAGRGIATFVVRRTSPPPELDVDPKPAATVRITGRPPWFVYEVTSSSRQGSRT